MLVEVLADPVEFRCRTDAFSRTEPLSTNVISVVNQRIIDENSSPTTDTAWVVITDGDEVVGTAMANGPWNLFMSPMPAGAPSLLADRLARSGRTLPGVIGSTSAADEFIDRWAALTGVQGRLISTRRAYVLVDLVPPLGVDGSARRFRAGEVALLALWLDVFHDEVLPEDPVVDNVELARRRLQAGEVWAWIVEDQPVAMAAHSAPAAEVARIGPVYTTPYARGRGFGGGATAAAARGAQDRGAAHVMLYADAANPTSNALYQRLGFTVDHDVEQYAFG